MNDIESSRLRASLLALGLALGLCGCGTLVDAAGTPLSGCEPGESAACYDDATKSTEGVGTCRGGTKTCGEDRVYGPCIGAVLPAEEACDATFLDEDCDGIANEIADGTSGGCACSAGDVETCYEGPAETQGVGLCRDGTRVCEAPGVWAECEGQVLPVPEVCDGNLDDEDCDGQFSEKDGPDSSCVCSKGDEMPCYDGPEGTEGVGACVAGTTTCDNWGLAWGPCVGEVLPQAETCDLASLDEDCDGETNEEGEGCLCLPGAILPCDYGGPAGTLGVGTCVAATATCDETGTDTGVCAGEVAPTCELCSDALDQDCDGVTTCNGGFRWAQSYGSVTAVHADYNEVANDIVFYPAGSGDEGSFVVAGSFGGTLVLGGAAQPITALGEDAVVIKLGPDRVPIWSRQMGSVLDNSSQRATSVAIDPQGDVYVAGLFAGTMVLAKQGGGSVTLDGPQGGATGMDVFVAKLQGLDGKVVWAKQLRSSDVTQAPTVATLAIGAGSATWLAGAFGHAAYFDDTTPSGPCVYDAALPRLCANTVGTAQDMFVAKLAGDTGAWLCAVGAGTPDVDDAIADMAIDDNGSPVVAGYASPGSGVSFELTPNLGGTNVTGAGGRDILVTRLANGANAAMTPAQQCQFTAAKLYGLAGDQEAMTVGFDTMTATTIVGGQFTGTMSIAAGSVLTASAGTDAFLAGFDSYPLTPSWAYGYAGTSNQELIDDLALGCDGDVIVTGRTLGVFPLSPTYVGASNDVFVARIQANAVGSTVRWAQGFGTMKDDQPGGIALGPLGEVAVVGRYNGVLQIGATQLVSLGSYQVTNYTDMFLASFNP